MSELKRIDQIIEGLKILSKYDEKGYSVCAEHDEIWAGPDSLEEECAEGGDGEYAILIIFDTVSKEDYEKLKELGWGIDPDVYRFSRFV